MESNYMHRAYILGIKILFLRLRFTYCHSLTYTTGFVKIQFYRFFFFFNTINKIKNPKPIIIY